MQFHLRLEPRAEKQLERIPAREQRKILAALPVIRENPFIGKKLSGKLDGAYSWRVWPYRILYTVHKHELLVFVIDIGHRQGVY